MFERLAPVCPTFHGTLPPTPDVRDARLVSSTLAVFFPVGQANLPRGKKMGGKHRPRKNKRHCNMEPRVATLCLLSYWPSPSPAALVVSPVSQRTTAPSLRLSVEIGRVLVGRQRERTRERTSKNDTEQGEAAKKKKKKTLRGSTSRIELMCYPLPPRPPEEAKGRDDHEASRRLSHRKRQCHSRDPEKRTRPQPCLPTPTCLPCFSDANHRRTIHPSLPFGRESRSFMARGPLGQAGGLSAPGMNEAVHRLFLMQGDILKEGEEQAERQRDDRETAEDATASTRRKRLPTRERRPRHRRALVSLTVRRRRRRGSLFGAPILFFPSRPRLGLRAAEWFSLRGDSGPSPVFFCLFLSHRDAPTLGSVQPNPPHRNCHLSSRCRLPVCPFEIVLSLPFSVVAWRRDVDEGDAFPGEKKREKKGGFKSDVARPENLWHLAAKQWGDTRKMHLSHPFHGFLVETCSELSSMELAGALTTFSSCLLFSLIMRPSPNPLFHPLHHHSPAPPILCRGRWPMQLSRI